MNTDELHKIFNLVCDAPDGEVFKIEHLPDLLLNSSINDSTPHVHTFYEILWIQEGEGVHTLDFQKYDVKPNTLFLITPGQVHYFDNKRDYKGVTIKLCNDFLKEDRCDTSLYLKYDVFSTRQSAPFYIDDDTALQLQSIVDEMENEVKHEDEIGHMDILRSLTRMLLIKVYRHGKNATKPRLDSLKPAQRLFMHFRNMLETEFTHMHTVQEYADKLNVAVRTLNKAVKDNTGISPLAFINDRIMIEAKRQVRYTNQMVKEVAFNLGFEDPSYFVKFFKRQTGVLPSVFRAQNESNQIGRKCKKIKPCD